MNNHQTAIIVSSASLTLYQSPAFLLLIASTIPNTTPEKPIPITTPTPTYKSLLSDTYSSSENYANNLLELKEQSSFSNLISAEVIITARFPS